MSPDNWLVLGKTQLPLSALRRRTIAVHVALPGRDDVLLGRGIYEEDADLGTVLRIELLAAASELILVEDAWNGPILSGEAHGCDFLIRLT
jgi:hypothetical protein